MTATGYLLALTNQFYDGTTAASAAPTLGDLRRVTRYYDIPANSSSTQGVTLHGSDTTFLYDSYGNRQTETTYTGASTRVFDGTTTTWGPLTGTARTSTTAYDGAFHALPISFSNALSQITRADYDDRMGTLIRVTDPNTSGTPTDCVPASFSIPATEASTCAQYDVFGRMIALIKPGDSTAYPTVQAAYFDTEQPFRYRVYQREQAGTGNVRYTQTFYDGLGQSIQTKQEGPGGWQNIVTDTRYDGLSQVVQQSQPRYSNETSTTFWQYTDPGTGNLFNRTSTSYDGLGRPLDVTAPDGSVTKTRYGIGSQGSATWFYDANGHMTASESDALGRLRWVYEYQGNNGSEGGYTNPATTTYTYSPLDLLIGVTDASGNSTSMGYDTLGRKKTMSDPDMGAWSYSYNPTGTLASQTDAKGQTISFGYDPLDRLTSRSMPGNRVASYVYDDTTGSNKGIGHRTSMRTTLNGASETFERWEFDARGRTTLAGQSIAGAPQAQDLIYSYDSADRMVTTMYYEASETVSTSYDAAWHPYSMCGTTCYVNSATYTALDQPQTRALNNGLTSSWVYAGPLQRLQDIQIGTVAAPTSKTRRGYAYDAVGNIQTITDYIWGQYQNFTYDHRDRLTHAWTTGGAGAPGMAYDITTTYNAIGNLTFKAGVGTYSYGSNGNGTGAGPHQARTIGAITLSYDANGNMAVGGAWTYTWNADNTLASMTNGTAPERYTYDADGERVAKLANSVMTPTDESAGWHPQAR